MQNKYQNRGIFFIVQSEDDCLYGHGSPSPDVTGCQKSRAMIFADAAVWLSMPDTFSAER